MGWVVTRRHRRLTAGVRLPPMGETVPEDHPRLRTLIRKRLVRWVPEVGEPQDAPIASPVSHPPPVEEAAQEITPPVAAPPPPEPEPTPEPAPAPPKRKLFRSKKKKRR